MKIVRGRKHCGITTYVSMPKCSAGTPEPVPEVPVPPYPVTEAPPATCGGDLTEDSGYISSENYPELYPVPATLENNCEWRIEKQDQPLVTRSTQEDMVIKLTIEDFHLAGICPNCRGTDWLQVFNGDDSVISLGSGNPLRDGKMCGDMEKPYAPVPAFPIYTKGPSAKLRFQTIQYRNPKTRGFNIKYEYVKKPNCQNQIIHIGSVSEEKFFNTPDYPVQYQPSSACDWTVTAPEGFSLALKFEDYEVAYYSSAHQDVTVAYDGMDKNAQQLIKFTGDRLKPGLVVASGNSIHLTFDSNSKKTNKGFRVKAYALAICDHNINLEELQQATISSFGYPENYPPNYKCTWIITVKEGQVVKFELDKADMKLFHEFVFNSETSEWELTSDPLKIWDGLDTTGEPDVTINEVGSWWGGLIHFSKGQTLTVVFAPGATNSAEGFTATVSSVASFKNKEIEIKEGESVTIASPHFEGHNIEDFTVKVKEADWTITAPPGSMVRFEITDFEHTEYWNHGLFLYKGLAPPQQGNLLDTIRDDGSAGVLPRVVYSPTNQMFAVFKMAEGKKKGFEATVSEIPSCAAKTISLVGGEKKVISSINENGKYIGHQNCDWTISVPVGFKVLLEAEELDTRPTIDKLSIFDGPDQESTLIFKFGVYLKRVKELPNAFGTVESMHVTFSSKAEYAKGWKFDDEENKWASDHRIPITGKGFQAAVTAVKVCTPDAVNSAACFCKSSTGGESCTAGQRCKKHGTCQSVLRVSGISTEQDEARIGSTLWTDESYVITLMPPELVGSTLFQPAHSVDISTIKVYSPNDATIYVGVHEARDGGLINQLPVQGWTLRDGWFVESDGGAGQRLDKFWSKQIDAGNTISFTTSTNGMTFAIFISEAQATCPDELPTAKTSNSDTWPAGFSFSLGSNVTLDFPLLLDTLSPRLSSLHLLAGGHLVFSPHVSLAKLTARYIIVDTGASLSIGSEQCPFEGKAEILLTGRKDSYQLDGDYRQNGEKFLSVMAGGKLEIHGRNKLSWTKLNKTVEANEGLITLYMEDDVSSWEPGDTIVLASTDFDMDQAEEVKVKVCRGRECVVEGGIKYHHYGLVDSGVDMRGEVGLITRNVLIHGEMEEECYGTQPCNIWGRDLFGGHVIATEGFDTFKVEHAEVTNMGQQGVMGRYPLHWHMAGDLVEGHSYVRSNSIHHNHQRCVTCHGSMGCVIEDNMAFETLGHCYFMEDGVEAATTMRGNLGINTRRGSMIPSDKDPSTFWITHPNSTITHNVAAGSRGKGFWFLQGANPTGASKKRQDEGVEHYFDKNELFHTALVDISHNVAHSSQFGIFFDKELGPDQSATGSGKFDPWKDPKNSKSERLDSHIQNLTCYKCFRTCVWIHFKRGQFSDIKTAESGEGMFTHDPTVISNSLFVGVSDGNMGVGRNWYRSLPSTKHQFGIKTYANPILLSNSEFRSFGSMSLAKIKYTAIGVRRSGVNSLMTGAHNITWTNVSTQHRFREDRNKESRQLVYRDYSGSVSGHPDWTIVHTFRHLVSPLCVAVPEWGPVSVCPHRYIGLPPMVDKMTASLSQMVVTRDDIPEYSFSLPSGDHFFYLSTDHSHIISFVDIDLPASSKVFLRPRGLDDGMVVQLGVCVPLGATVEVHKNSPVSSMCALHEDNTGLVYFHDEVAGVVFVKMIGTYVREHLDVDPCGKDAEACPNFPAGKAKLIKIDGSGSASLKADCRSRQGVYPKYQILKSAPNPAPFDETRCMEEIAEYNAESVTNPELHPITEEFPEIVVHGVHSMTLANLRYYFDKKAATNNGIPVINFNLSSSEPPVLRSIPDLPLLNNFTHPAMDALDMTLSHMTDNNWGTRNASPLERVIHAIHMLEVWEMAKPFYKQIKRNKCKYEGLMKKLCPRVTAVDENGILEMMEDTSVIWRYGSCTSCYGGKRPGSIFSRLRPDLGQVEPDTTQPTTNLTNEVEWEIWKANMDMSQHPESRGYQLALYLFCALN